MTTDNSGRVISTSPSEVNNMVKGLTRYIPNTDYKHYGNKIIIDSEKHIEKTLQEFLDSAPNNYVDFKIEYINSYPIGEYSNRESKIFMCIIFSYNNKSKKVVK